MMIAEEEGLKKRLMSSIEACRKELACLCDELQLLEYQVSILLISIKSQKEKPVPSNPQTFCSAGQSDCIFSVFGRRKMALRCFSWRRISVRRSR